MKPSLFFTLLVFYCQSVLGAERNFPDTNDCGCSSLSSQAGYIERQPIDLPGCPCKQLPYLKQTFSAVVEEPMGKYKDAFLSLIWGLKDAIEEKKGEMSLTNHNKNMSLTYTQLEKYKRDYVDQLHCMLCPLVKHFGYAQLTLSDYEGFCVSHSESIAVFGGKEMFDGIVFLIPDLKDIARTLLDRSSQ